MSEEGKTHTVPQTLHNMIEAFNSLNDTIQHLAVEAKQLADEVSHCTLVDSLPRVIHWYVMIHMCGLAAS